MFSFANQTLQPPTFFLSIGPWKKTKNKQTEKQSSDSVEKKNALGMPRPSIFIQKNTLFSLRNEFFFIVACQAGP